MAQQLPTICLVAFASRGPGPTNGVCGSICGTIFRRNQMGWFLCEGTDIPDTPARGVHD